MGRYALGTMIAVLALFLAPAAAPEFTVTAGGAPISLHECEGGHFGRFTVGKPLEVSIQTAFDTRWADVRPLSAGIKPKIENGVVRFTVAKPVPLTIEFNGEWKKVLHLFADPPEKTKPPANARVFAAGVHDAGVIELKDGETLYLAEGAWVKGQVRARNVRDIAIHGRGVLDGTDQPRSNMVFFEGVSNAVIEGVTVFHSKTWTVHIRNSEGIRIDGLKILNYQTGTDGIDLVATSRVMVENTFVRANDDCVVVKTFNGAGKGPDVRDITVRKSVFWNMPWGNAIEIGFELRAARVEKILFDDIDIIRVERGAALSIHNGDAAVVEDVEFRNIRIEDAQHKLIDLAVVYGQYGADRPPQDQRAARYMRGAWDGVLRFPPEEAAERARFRGQIRNIRFKNIHVVDGKFAFSVIAGFDADHTVENVTIEGLIVHGRPVRRAEDARLSVAHARGVAVR